MKSLRIGFDAKRLFHNREGLGSYARTLVADLQQLYPHHQYVLFTPAISNHAYAKDYLDPAKYQVITAPASQPHTWWRAKGMVQAIKQAELDVYWGLSNELPFGISNLPVKTMVTIHDMIYKAFPQQFGKVDRWIYHQKFSHAISKADRIIVPSEHTRQDIVKYFPNAEKDITKLYQAVHSQYRGHEQRKGSGSHYLIVGSINERKNLKLVVEAYKLLSEAQRRPVKVVGQGKQYLKEVQSEIRKAGLTDYFSFEGNLSNAALVQLYKSAIALVFPSRYEGFGIPIVEALSLGVPVIGNDCSSIPEVLGKYGIIFEYDRPEALKEAILQTNAKLSWPMDSDPAEQLIAFGYQSICQTAIELIVSLVD